MRCPCCHKKTAKELAKAILKEDRIPNASALSEGVSTENKIPEHSSAKRRRKSNAPGKRKGKGKGRSAEVKYYCGLCKEEYIEEEWVQCSSVINGFIEHAMKLIMKMTGKIL